MKNIERMLLDGVCPCCLKPMKAWTAQEVQEAKADLGLPEHEDMFGTCDACEKQFGPESDLDVHPVLLCHQAHMNAANYAKGNASAAGTVEASSETP